MSFEVTIIGSNSAVPAHGRNPSAQVVTISDKLYLIDCGEGTQMRFQHCGIKWSKINQIFISHLHGDHYFGLIGLISTYHLLKRIKPLEIFAPAPLLDIINAQLHVGKTTLCYELIFHPTDSNTSKLIYENDEITVETIILNHRIDCTGFLFREKQKDRKINRDKMQEHNISFDYVPELKKGNDIQLKETGESFSNAELTIDPPQARSYAYCCDTAYDERILHQLKNTDLLYHDCTFDKSGVERAKETFHTTTEQAATMAKKACVQKLLIGHFSAKYSDLNILLEEAKEVFQNTELAIEGITFEIPRIAEKVKVVE
ncbi:MAG: ribonuclease Z [Chitinophagales bacterium]|nr:ribonuclease Z [Chitinophagales bacterium]MBP8755220.1 ribonuclease Z [Chitinophagales bacterium]MBP9190569.1 ribonuclease Z [Chitinophagales bacterium]MBP9705551.1 ribonuclease Z [Chitinophagales bacterium]